MNGEPKAEHGLQLEFLMASSIFPNGLLEGCERLFQLLRLLVENVLKPGIVYIKQLNMRVNKTPLLSFTVRELILTAFWENKFFTGVCSICFGLTTKTLGFIGAVALVRLSGIVEIDLSLRLIHFLFFLPTTTKAL